MILLIQFFFTVGSYTTAHPLQAQQLGSLADDGVLLGEAHVLETSGVGGGDLGTSNTDGGSSQVVETVFHGESEDLGGDTEHGVTGLDAHDATSLLERLDNSLNVEGLDGTKVDDLSINTVLLLQLSGSVERLSNTAGESDNGQVLSGALNLGLANRKNKVILLSGLAHGEGLTVQQPMQELSDSKTFHRYSDTSKGLRTRSQGQRRG